MPTYEHYCKECDTITDVVCRVNDRKQFVVCKLCNGSAERIISRSQGLQTPNPTWLSDAINHACPHGVDVQKPEDRNEFNSFLKANRIEHVG